ncbi:hypothetical protein [Arthrobacter sp. PAMC25564]|uniref:hypothetical protein n=1 Tax=Arthrobacter sp. PAMC25564 TaxID=2565366 RepID=UPI001F1016FA|nr:hypothetical protein [Arthrobacter sp. PAMC25564]
MSPAEAVAVEVSDGVGLAVWPADPETDGDVTDAVGPAAGGPHVRMTATTVAASSTSTATTATRRRRLPANIDHMLHLGTIGTSGARAERPSAPA